LYTRYTYIINMTYIRVITYASLMANHLIYSFAPMTRETVPQLPQLV